MVETLKKMNQNYPNSHEDFDEQFIFLAAGGIFTRAELKICSDSKTLRKLKAANLKFLKGVHVRKKKKKIFFDVYFILVDLIVERIGADNKRMGKVRQKILSVAYRIGNTD